MRALPARKSNSVIGYDPGKPGADIQVVSEELAIDCHYCGRIYPAMRSGGFCPGCGAPAPPPEPSIVNGAVWPH